MTEKSTPIVSVAPDGPYIVKGLTGLRTVTGDLETRETIALCRCGGSKNKPFCDGTHAKNGFSGENLADSSKDKRKTYVGAGITVYDNRSICAHAGRCTDGLASVFRMHDQPWIDADGATVDEIIGIIKQCPSGALSFSVDGVEHSKVAAEPSIMVAKGGPYVITGGLELVDVPRAEGAPEGHCTLCRCGGSKNKPFCDGTHWNIDFDEASDEQA